MTERPRVPEAGIALGHDDRATTLHDRSGHVTLCPWVLALTYHPSRHPPPPIPGQAVSTAPPVQSPSTPQSTASTSLPLPLRLTHHHSIPSCHAYPPHTPPHPIPPGQAVSTAPPVQSPSIPPKAPCRPTHPHRSDPHIITPSRHAPHHAMHTPPSLSLTPPPHPQGKRSPQCLPFRVSPSPQCTASTDSPPPLRPTPPPLPQVYTPQMDETHNPKEPPPLSLIHQLTSKCMM